MEKTFNFKRLFLAMGMAGITILFIAAILLMLLFLPLYILGPAGILITLSLITFALLTYSAYGFLSNVNNSSKFK